MLYSMGLVKTLSWPTWACCVGRALSSLSAVHLVSQTPSRFCSYQKNLKLIRPTLSYYLVTPEEAHPYFVEVMDAVKTGLFKVQVEKSFDFSAEGVQAAQEELATPGNKLAGKLLINFSTAWRRRESGLLKKNNVRMYLWDEPRWYMIPGMVQRIFLRDL